MLAIAYATYKKKYCSFKKTVLGQLRNCPRLPGKDAQDLLFCYRGLHKGTVFFSYKLHKQLQAWELIASEG